MSNPCSFCYTGSKGTADCGPNPTLVSLMLRDGPYAEGRHPICPDCLEKKAHLRRARCQWCGKLSSLLRTAHDSMTTKWADVGGSLLLCDVCQGELYDGKQWSPDLKARFDRYVLLTDDEIELLKILWKKPNWKTCTRMPVIRRTIDDL